jgi:hypothetical protein
MALRIVALKMADEFLKTHIHTQRRWTNLNSAHFSTFDYFFSFDVNQKNYYKFFSVVEE